jgi:hypothetical protein
MSGTQGAPRRGKRGKSAYQCTAQVVVGIAVATRELRTPQPQNGLDACRSRTLCEQCASHPQIHDAPVRLRKTPRNLPSPHPGLVAFSGLDGGYGGWSRAVFYRRRGRPATESGRLDRLDGSLGRDLQQSFGATRQASGCVHDLHPGCITAESAPLRLLIVSTQVTVFCLRFLLTGVRI